MGMNLHCLRRTALPLALLAALSLGAPSVGTAASSSAAKRHKHKKHKRTTRAAADSRSQAAVIHTSTTTRKSSLATRRHRRRVLFNPWTEPTYADSTVGDNVDGEDLVVRKAAVDALGPYNGSIVVADPQTGRILSMVN